MDIQTKLTIKEKINYGNSKAIANPKCLGTGAAACNLGLSGGAGFGWRDMTVAEALRDGAAQLLTAGIDNPRLEARLLLAHALGCAPIALIRDLTAPVDTDVYDALLSRRASHEPLAYLVGRREFWSLDLAVSPATLIPRPDSETLH